MKARVNTDSLPKGHLDREGRRMLKKKVAPIAKQVAKYELLAKHPDYKEEAETKIAELMDSLTIMEMMAVEDYIMSKGLLESPLDKNKNKNTQEKKEN